MAAELVCGVCRRSMASRTLRVLHGIVTASRCWKCSAPAYRACVAGVA